MRIYLVRHGESTNNAGMPRVPDPPLTSRGHQQAQQIAEALRAESPAATALYVSPMRRALETAHYIHEALGLAPHVIPRLCESGGVGNTPGLCRQEMLREWPKITLDEAITEAGWWEPTREPETELRLYARATEALAAMRERHIIGSDTLILVTHGTFGSMFLSTLLGLSPIGYARFSFNNCAVSRADIELLEGPFGEEVAAFQGIPADSPVESVWLRFHNAISHLPPDLLT